MIKIKTLYLFLFFLKAANIVTAQKNNQHITAKVSYGVHIHLDKNSDLYKSYEKFLPGLVANAELVDSEVDFSLVLNDSTSIFYIEEKLFSNNKAASFVIRNVGFYGRIKQQDKNFITEETQEEFGKFLVSRPYQKWELHNETKKIGDYICFKATTFHTVTSPNGKIFKYDFTAWYTPQMPYKFGPAGYGNLPGLIMELQGDKFTYNVKKIQFHDDIYKKENQMPKLRNLKTITEEEFEALAAVEEMKRQKNE